MNAGTPLRLLITYLQSEMEITLESDEAVATVCHPTYRTVPTSGLLLGNSLWYDQLFKVGISGSSVP